MLLRKLAAKVLITPPEEFASGIPAARETHPVPTVKSPQTWEFAAQRHESVGAAKTHIDLRLVDPSGKAHSWALPKARLPEPGERVLAVPQPTHTRSYAALRGTFDIEEGYGKGRVHSTGLEPVEVVQARPGVIRFNRYTGTKSGTQEYILSQTPSGHLLQNVTATAAHGIPGTVGGPIPQSKPDYREVKEPEKLQFEDPRTVHQTKLDGAHVTFHLYAGRPVKVFSYRPTERATGVIEHTHKIPGWFDLVPPKELHNTVVRGELFGMREGKAIPNAELGGLLNSTTWNSRKQQEETGTQLRRAIFDVVKFRGHNMEQTPYVEKLEVLKQIQARLPELKIPPTATTPAAKRKLFEKIEAGKHPLTDEGVVEWHLDRPLPTKFKFRPDHDAEVVGVTPGAGKFKDAIGALQVKLPGKDAVTHVGTGLSEELRRQIAQSPHDYIGRVAKVRSQQVFPSGKMRAPSFAGWHLEKGKQPMEKGAALLRSLAAEVL